MSTPIMAERSGYQRNNSNDEKNVLINLQKRSNAVQSKVKSIGVRWSPLLLIEAIIS